jgi:hypothetical protein
VFNLYDKECPQCYKNALPVVDAKKPVHGPCLCKYTFFMCLLDTVWTKKNGGVVPVQSIAWDIGRMMHYVRPISVRQVQDQTDLGLVSS